jgi:UDP-N-acetylmuramate dehydrogenase
LTAFVDFCIANGYAGTEMLAGIPGLLGGAIVMNAGAYGGAISDFITDVTILRHLTVRTIPKEECGFTYRHSGLQNDIVLSARFALPLGDTETLRATRKEFILKRNQSQPTSLPNAGCIFKNPDGMHTARLIQECGLKGFRSGGAEVSSVHANFIVAHEGATAADVLDVINHVRRIVRDMKGVVLELEVQLIGFPVDAVEALMTRPGSARIERRNGDGSDG